jgi:hypothetical protein
MEICTDKKCKYFGKKLIKIEREKPYDSLLICKQSLPSMKLKGYKQNSDEK